MSKDPTPVARRKLEGSYLRFIKNAQKFYRGYVRELAAVHGNVPELERAARKVGNESAYNHSNYLYAQSNTFQLKPSTIPVSRLRSARIF
jgi:hypothetical protein